MADRQRLMEALRNADAAGDTSAAQKFAEAIRNMDGAPPPQSRSFMEQVREGGIAAPAKTVAADIIYKGRADEAQKQAEIRSQLGGRYDPKEDLGYGGLANQIDVARSQSLEDKRTKFLNKYPEGEFQGVPTSFGAVPLASRAPGEPLRELPSLPKFMGALASEPTLGAMGAAAIAPPAVLPAAMLTGAGVLSGLVAQKQIERGRGYGNPEGTLMGDVGASLPEAGIASGIDFATRGLLSRFGIRPSTPARTEMDEAMVAGERQGLPALARGQASESPFTRGLFRQVGATSERPSRVVSNQERALLDRFRNQVDDGVSAGGMSDDALLKVIQAQTRELASLNPVAATGRDAAGESLQKGLETYERATSRLAQRFYNKASENAEGVKMNISGAQDAARAMLRGQTRPAAGGGRVRIDEPPKGEFKDTLETIAALESKQIDYADKTAFETVKTLRTRLFDYMKSDDPAVARSARSVWKELSKAMDNPIGGTKNSRLNREFVRKHEKAKNLWKWREQTLERSYVANALKSDTPEKLAAKYYQPGNTTALREMKEIVPKPQWKKFQEGYQTELLNTRTAREGLTRLERFQAVDPDGLALLMSPAEQKVLRRSLEARRKFELSPANKALDKNFTEAERAMEIVTKGSTQDVADFVRLAGGKSAQQSQALKSGIYKDILDNSMDITAGGREVLDANKVIANIQKWKQSGKLEPLFDDADWQRLLDFQKYSAPLSETADIGGGMMAGALRQQAIDAPTGLLTDASQVLKKFVKPLYQNELTAFYLSRPATYHTLPKSVYNSMAGAPATYTVLQRELNKFDRDMKRRERASR